MYVNFRKQSKIKKNTTDKRRANCSQTTGERLASSVASHGDAPGADGGNTGFGGNIALGGGGNSGGGVSQPLRTAIHTIRISHQKKTV